MHISGILVRTAPERVGPCAAALAALPGVEVDRVDVATGSIVVVQETRTRDEQEESLRRIQRLPGVGFAELVCHLIDPPGDEERPGEPSASSSAAAERKANP